MIKVDVKLHLKLQELRRRIDRGIERLLGRAGSYIRNEARKSLRPARRKTGRDTRGRFRRDGSAQISGPGEPPRTHGGEKGGPLRGFILYAVDTKRREVVIGPAKLPKVGAAPAALEHGGASVMITRKRVYNEDRKPKWVRTGTKPIHVRARPFMRPAYARVMQRSRELFGSLFLR